MKKDKDKTKEQLIDELGKLRQKLRKLEDAEARRKQTEKILKESEEKYKLLVETSNDMIFTVDLKGNFLFANKAFKKILGYSKEEIKKINGFKLVHPEDMSRVIKQFAQLVEGKKVDNMEYRYKAKNGSYIHLLNNASPIFDPRGNVVAAFGIARNITQRKKMEEELHRAYDELERRVKKRTAELVSINKKLEKEIKEREKMEEELIRLSTAVKMSVDGVIIADLDANIIDVNRAVLKKHGFKHKKEMVGKNSFQFIAPEDREKLLLAIRKMAQKGYIEGVEYRILTKDGRKIPVEANGIILREEDGQPKGFVATVRDITERKQEEEALRESEENYRQLADSIADVFFEMDKDLRYTYWNKASENLTGISAKNALEKSLYELFPDVRGTEVDKFYLTALKTNKSKSFVNEYKLNDKNYFFEITAYPSKRGLSVFVKDITERKSTEQELSIRDWAIKSSISAIALADLEGNLMYVNDSFLRLWGYEDEKEVIGKPAIKFWRTEEEALNVIESLQDKWNWVGELEATKKDGSAFDVQLSASMVTDANGNPICMMASFIDVTEHKRAEKAQTSLYKISEAAHSAKNLEELYCSIHNIVNELMPANNFYIALYDSTSKTLSFSYFVDEYEKNPGPQKLGKGLTEYVLRTGKPLLASPKVFNDLKKRGEVISVGPPSIDWLGVPLKTTDKTIGVLTVQSYTEGIRFSEKDKSILTFISEQVAMAIERKKIERELKESEERYKDLVEKADIAILIDDKDGNIEYFNEKLLDLLGYSVEEVRKMSIQSIVHPDDVDRVMQYHQGRLQGKKVPSRYEFKGIRKDGSTIYLEVDAVKQREKGEIIGSRSYIWDITERKRAERELQESMELFQKTFISQQDAIFLLDANQPPLIIDCNPAAMNIFGYTRLEMLGRSSVFLHVNQTMLKKFQAQLYPVIEKSGFLFLPEFKMKRKNGTVFSSEHSVIPLKNEQGKRIGWVSVIRDITERKRAEEVLKESEEKFRNLAEQSPNMIFIHKKGQVVYANKKCEEMTGYKREEFYSPGFDFMTLIAPESKDLIRASFTKHKKGQNVPPYEYTLITKKGQRIEALLTSQLINFEGERAILGIVTDITEHKIAEEKYRSLYSAMNEGVCLHEIDYDDKGKVVDYRFIDINPAYESITGLKKEKAIGSKASQLYGTANPPFLNIFAKVAETGEPASIETYFPPLKKYFIISAFSPEKGKFATVFTDITERHNTERELIEAKDQAETALKKLEKVQSQLIQSERLAALGKLSAGIAHEINNPLSIISGHAQILLMAKSPGRAELKKTAEIIEKQVDRASSITDQLLQFSKRIKPKLKKSDVNEILKDTLALLKQQLSQDNIKIVKLLSSKPVFIQADSLQLQQVFLNLIANASHAMPNGGTLTINTIVKDTNLEIGFTDSGCGIPERNLSKLFEPFFTTKENGTGLGLSIAYGIIKAHKGDIKVKSEEGKGTTFTIIFPYE
jgi:PAS domain S-box-containing protein